MNFINKLTCTVNLRNICSLAMLFYLNSSLALANYQDDLGSNKSIVNLGNINSDFGVTDKEKIKPLVIFNQDKDEPNNTPYRIGDVLSFESVESWQQFFKKYDWSIRINGNRNSLEYKHRTLVVDFDVYVPYISSLVKRFPDWTFLKTQGEQPTGNFTVAQATCGYLSDCKPSFVPASSLSDMYIKHEILRAEKSHLRVFGLEGGYKLTIYDYSKLSGIKDLPNFWKYREEELGVFQKGKYNVVRFFIPANIDAFKFKPFDTLDEAKKYIDDFRSEQLKNSGHYYSGSPSKIIQPDGYIYYRGYDVNGKKDVQSESKAKFLSYSSSPPVGKYYFQDNFEVGVIYGSHNRYYAFESLEEALNSLGATYTDVIPTRWDREDGDYTNYSFPRMPYKLYRSGTPDEGWFFGTRVGALYGPNGKLIVNFNASRGGSNCQIWVGTQYAKYAKFWRAAVRNQEAPIGEQRYGCDTTDSDEYQPGLIGQPGFPTEYPRLPPWPTLDLHRK